MVKSYNLKEYGLRLKELRNSLNYTRNEVADHARISKDTLYKLESGQSLPKYDTLETLSNFYKFDLLKLLLEYRSSSIIFAFNQLIEELIIDYDQEKLKALKLQFEEIKALVLKNEVLIDFDRLEQYELLVNGIIQFNSDHNKECLTTYVNAMRITKPGFTYDTWDEFRYDLLELRILILIAKGLYLSEEFDQSSEILKYVLLSLNHDNRATLTEKQLIAKCYHNISYNAHRNDDFHSALYYAEKGIKFSLDNHLDFILGHLWYRKGISLFLQKEENFLEPLYNAICVFQSKELYSVRDQVLKITKRMYNIDIYDYIKNQS